MCVCVQEREKHFDVVCVVVLLHMCVRVCVYALLSPQCVLVFLEKSKPRAQSCDCQCIIKDEIL